MLEDDPLRAYIEALREYEKERKKAAKMIKSIEDMWEKIRHKLPDFATLTYGLPMPAIPGMQLHRSADQSARADMTKWPDAETIRTTIVSWHAAYLKVRQAWSAIPTSDRIGMREPPLTLSTR